MTTLARWIRSLVRSRRCATGRYVSPEERELLRMARGDEVLANRLIRYEQTRDPSATRRSAAADAIARWRRDRG